MQNNFQSSAPLSAEFNPDALYAVIAIILGLIFICSLTGKLGDGIINQSEVVSLISNE